MSGPISRVLSLDGHLSRAGVATGLERATRTRGGPPHSVPICVCSGWGLPSRVVAGALVRSYRTVSAFLPAINEIESQRSGEFSFLWHCPSGRPAQLLAGILPCGARTFLLQSKRPPDPLTSSILSFFVACRPVRVLRARKSLNLTLNEMPMGVLGEVWHVGRER